MNRICVFCGSNDGINPAFSVAAVEVGQFIVKNNIELVFGGGRVGLMGKIADTVLAYGGKVIGIIPESLAEREVAHQGLTKLHIVDSMHERKALMAELSDGFIAMPGGFGTFEEICEIITWAQLGFHGKPCGLLNIEGYYDDLISMFDKATSQKFIRDQHRSLVLESDTIDELYELMENFVPPNLEKWIDRAST